MTQLPSKAPEKDIEKRCEQLVNEIHQIEKDFILDIYNKAKELYTLRKQIDSHYSYFQLSTDLGYNSKWAKQLFMLNKSSVDTWALIEQDKLSPRIVLKVLNFNPRLTVPDQNKILRKIVNENMNDFQINRLLRSEYADELIEAEKEQTQYSNLLYRNLVRTKELLMIMNPQTMDETHYKVVREEIKEIMKLIETKVQIQTPPAVKKLPNNSQKNKFAELESKRELNNSYMKKIRAEINEDEMLNTCILCGKEHKAEDDLCPECRKDMPDYENDIMNQ